MCSCVQNTAADAAMFNTGTNTIASKLVPEFWRRYKHHLYRYIFSISNFILANIENTLFTNLNRIQDKLY